MATKKKKRDKPINSRRKGKEGELEVAHIMQDYGFDARRGQQFSGLHGDADVVGVPYLHLEIKRVKSLNLDKAMEQSIRDAREGEIPIVVHRKDRQPWRVTIDLDDFMPMYMVWCDEQQASLQRPEQMESELPKKPKEEL